MDEILARQLLRQLRVIKLFLAFFGTIIIVSLLAFAILLFKVVTFVHDSSKQINDIQQKASSSLHIKNELCSSSSISSFLQDKTAACK